MKVGDSILILPSFALIKLRLNALIGKQGKIVEIVKKNERLLGCWVELSQPFENETEWFIPEISIGHFLQ